jgi:hypothetical protein
MTTAFLMGTVSLMSSFLQNLILLKVLGIAY